MKEKFKLKRKLKLNEEINFKFQTSSLNYSTNKHYKKNSDCRALSHFHTTAKFSQCFCSNFNDLPGKRGRKGKKLNDCKLIPRRQIKMALFKLL